MKKQVQPCPSWIFSGEFARIRQNSPEFARIRDFWTNFPEKSWIWVLNFFGNFGEFARIRANLPEFAIFGRIFPKKPKISIGHFLAKIRPKKGEFSRICIFSIFLIFRPNFGEFARIRPNSQKFARIRPNFWFFLNKKNLIESKVIYF